MKVVGRAAPFHKTVELETKLVPFTVRVNAGPPVTIVLGLKDVMVGAAGEGGC